MKITTQMMMQVASATPSAARDDVGWMDLLQFITPSSAATGQVQKPELDSAALLIFLDAYQVHVCLVSTPMG